MKIVVTGSLGHISRPLTQDLVSKGHSVTVISHSPDRKKEIEKMGAAAAIGGVEDAGFLASAFKDADSAYCMLPPGHFFDKEFDLTAFVSQIANNYADAVRRNNIRRVVFLSSIGAHTDKGNGILAIYYLVEKILNGLPAEVAITFLRPVGFYYNLYGFMDSIRAQRVIATNYGGDGKKPWVAPADIAVAAAEEILSQSEGRKVRYVASDELSCNELASVLGAAVGKPDLKWKIIPGEKVLAGMIGAGMNPQIAAGLVEMNESTGGDALYEDYYKNRPALGKVKITNFAKEFAAVYNKK